MVRRLSLAGCCAVVLAGMACAAAPQGDKLTPKVLVVMLDGLRADVVDNGLAPNMRRLADGTWRSGYHGAWTQCANTLRDGTTESAPNHVGIATGMPSFNIT